MRPYQIISDSSCDIPADLLPKLNIGIVPYYATFDTINYHKELLDLTPEEFYDKVKEAKVFPKTSLPPIQDYIDVFEPYLKEGKDIVCMCLTAKFSGSFQSANNAKQILLETYPDSRIEVVDTISVTLDMIWISCWKHWKFRNRPQKSTSPLILWTSCSMADV